MDPLVPDMPRELVTLRFGPRSCHSSLGELVVNT
jgi:hypothetical protein